MIAHLLLDQKQKTVLKKIFKIMDASGDGELESDELRKGFTAIFDSPNDRDEKGNQLMDRDWSDEELGAIIQKVDHNDNGFLDYRDFLMASVDLSKEAFLKYCERAFERFFTNDTMSLQTNKLYEILCEENIFRRELVQIIINLFDEDGSDSIQFKELIDALLKHLGEDIVGGITYREVEKHIETRFEIDLPNADDF